jgi:putative transposase
MVTPYANCYSDGDNRAPGNIMPVTNLLERMFGEERRRTKVIPHAFGEHAAMKLMYAALMRARQGWRNVIVTPFELKQIEMLREQLKAEFDQRHAPPVKSASRSRIHSTNGT